MLHASTQQLIRKLCELTEASAITWIEGDAGASIFETEGYLVEIRAEPTTVRLLRADGRELERADAADLALPWPEGEGTYASRVCDMARRAERIARGAETAIAKILSSLSAPPKNQGEPEPAAIAFEPELPPRPAPSVESAAAIAAVSADLESQRRMAAEEPPVSHSLPEVAPILHISAETETAIDRVLAVQSANWIEEPLHAAVDAQIPSVEIAATAALAPTPPLEEAPTPEPVAVAASRALGLPASEMLAASDAVDPVPPLPVVEAPPPARQEAATPRPAFGAIGGFSRAPASPRPAPPAPQVEREATPEPSKMTSTGLLVKGFSARSRQTAEAAMTKDIFRSAPAPAAPQPPEKQLAPAAGADIYKPWA